MTIRIRKGDEVLVIGGKDRGKKGTVKAVDPRAISSAASRPATGGAPCWSMSGSAASAEVSSRSTAGLVATASTAAAAWAW